MKATDKPAIRRWMADRLRRLDPVVWTDAAHRITERLETLPQWRTAGHVALYLALPDEIPTDPMIDRLLRRGSAVYVPAYDAGQDIYRPAAWQPGEPLQTARYGVRQPLHPRWAGDVRLDLIVTPGRAFTPDGARLGRGAGYYDRFLAAPWAAGAFVLGVALACQVIDAIPTESHDIRMRRVVSDQAIYGGDPCRPPVATDHDNESETFMKGCRRHLERSIV